MYELSIEKPSVDGKTADATNAYEALKADPKSKCLTLTLTLIGGTESSNPDPKCKCLTPTLIGGIESSFQPHFNPTSTPF